MLRLRVTAPEGLEQKLVGELGGITGVHRVTDDIDLLNGGKVLTADLAPSAADAVMDRLNGLGVDPEDYVIVREELVAPRMGPGSAVEPEDGFAWIEVLGEARANARPVARYVVLMAVAGLIAGLGVTTNNTILIVGAMAVSPDLLPICATCVGLVGKRLSLASRAFGTLILGMVVVMLVSTLIGLGVELVLQPENPAKDYLGGLGNLATVDYATVLIALGAGVAAILSFETRAANAVGVAISVTTVPASAYLGVGLGVGEIGEAIGALLVLGVNVFLMILTGTITLFFQRKFAPGGLPGKFAGDRGSAGSRGSGEGH